MARVAQEQHVTRPVHVDLDQPKMRQQRLKVVGRVEIFAWLPKGFASELADGVIVCTAKPQLLPCGQRCFYV